MFLLSIIGTIWQGEEIGKEKIELEKLDEKRDNNTTQGVCCRREAGSDDAYSSVYNVLQPNYGTERCRPQQWTIGAPMQAC